MKSYFDKETDVVVGRAVENSIIWTFWAKDLVLDVQEDLLKTDEEFELLPLVFLVFNYKRLCVCVSVSVHMYALFRKRCSQ